MAPDGAGTEPRGSALRSGRALLLAESGRSALARMYGRGLPVLDQR